MADAVTSQTILDDGGKNLIMKFTNISDGTGESNVAKIDVSALTAGMNGQACSRVVLNKVWFSNVGMGFKLLWNASSNVHILQAPADWADTWDFTDSSMNLPGIPNNAGSGVNGDLLLTTVGHSSGDAYSIVIWATKGYEKATTA
jgi:hypothetical protein|tara:strand:+ start:794 stop:1228 length:435 start_codon:yes stop_codon:yes gene_type:complete